MEIITSINPLRERVRAGIKKGKIIGFVPTMGFLHKGHISLIKQARAETDLVVASIFVNPTQFGENEDFDAYPRNEERDSQLCEEAGVDLLFMPTVPEMYPDEFATFVMVESPLTGQLCGQSRPGHFKGVTTIVSKLFGIVKPDRAYFGQKDAQQVLVIKKMVADLNMDIQVVTCPIIREADGLAMSSRNAYLSTEERKEAKLLSQSLQISEKAVLEGERNALTIRKQIRQKIDESDRAVIDYIEIVNATTLEPAETLAGDILIALAVKIGTTRLIDNIVLEL